MTPEIERIQNEIGLNLVNICPVKWDKICFRAICNETSSDIYYCFIESETKVISSCDNEDVRFKSEWYKVDIKTTTSNLLKLPMKLYCEYEKIKNTNAMWSAFTFILNSDYSFNIDFEYETEGSTLLNRKQWCLKYFGEEAIYYYKGLYPDTTDVIK